MARMSIYRQKQYNKRILFFIAALVGMVILFSTVGFNLLIKTSILIGNLTKGKSQNENSQSAFFGSLDIDTPPQATNSAMLQISGSVNGYDTVNIYINDKKVKTITNKADFTETVGDLQKGDNQLVFTARSSENKTQSKQQSFTVTYKPDKPKLEVGEPADGSKTNRSEIKVAGKTDPDTTVEINDLPTVVDAQGGFTNSVRLKEGDNKITVTATDIAGNTEVKEINLRYEKD